LDITAAQATEAVVAWGAFPTGGGVVGAVGVIATAVEPLLLTGG
jgi:hypothetical protein